MALSAFSGSGAHLCRCTPSPGVACVRDGSGGARPQIRSPWCRETDSIYLTRRAAICQTHVRLRKPSDFSTFTARYSRREVRCSGSEPRQQGSGAPHRKGEPRRPVPPKLGYHPLEELSSAEKGKGSARIFSSLTFADVARTIAEVNSEAIVFASIVQSESVLGTDVNFLVDHAGDVYMEIDNDDAFLDNLENDNKCSLLLGFGKLDEVLLSDLVDQVGDNEDLMADIEGDEESLTDEEVQYFFEQAVEGVEDGFSPESMGGLGAWGGPETLQFVHPMEFALMLSEVATSDYAKDIENPGKRLTITGLLRRATWEEQQQVAGLWEERFTDTESEGVFMEGEGGEEEGRVWEEGSWRYGSCNPEESLEWLYNRSEQKSGEGDEEERRRRELRQDAVQRYRLLEGLNEISEDGEGEGEGEGEGDGEGEGGGGGGSVLYKLEIVSIQIDSATGIQEWVDVGAWSEGRPDMLAHAAHTIIERANSMDRARLCMAELCLRERGMAVDEVSMVGIDHLGIDLRCRMGREMMTVRFPFHHPATSERSAEKLLDELLRPRQGGVRRLPKHDRQVKRAKGRATRS